MSATLTELEERVAKLERTVAELPRPADNQPANRGYEEAVERFLEHLGIAQIQPIGALRVQALIAAEGGATDTPEASREIVAMREE